MKLLYKEIYHHFASPTKQKKQYSNKNRRISLRHPYRRLFFNHGAALSVRCRTATAGIARYPRHPTYIAKCDLLNWLCARIYESLKAE